MKKQVKTVDTVLNLCTTKEWLVKGSLFPSYLDLDDDETPNIDEVVNPLHELRTELNDVEHKLELLMASEQLGKEGIQVVDQEGVINFDKIKTATEHEPELHALYLRSIAESMNKLKVLDKSILNRNFKEVDEDRTVILQTNDVEHIREAIYASKILEENRFKTLAMYRSLEFQQESFNKLFTDTKLDL